jgi:hypothetical protein
LRRAFGVSLAAALSACSGGGGASSPGTSPVPTAASVAASGSPSPTPAGSLGPTASPSGSASPVSTPGGPASGGPSTSPTSTPPAIPTPSASASPAGTSAPAALPVVGGCVVLPADNPWNTDVSGYPLDPKSGAYLAEMNPRGSTKLHPDFGSNPSYGIPYNVDGLAPAAFTPIAFLAYASESDPGPYPIPSGPAIEAGSDRHMLIVDSANCTLYETFDTKDTSGGWTADAGAVWPLDSDALRTEGWTSADAAGLPILPGLARYDEVAAGAIHHALRFTMSKTAQGHVHPATHDASTSSNPNAPPMGLRIRLAANYDLSGYTGESLVVLQALKRYGAFLADNGSDFYISGATDTRWNDNDLSQIKNVPASAFEVVETGPVITP